jgi:hypothetical protein
MMNKKINPLTYLQYEGELSEMLEPFELGILYHKKVTAQKQICTR